MAYSLKHHFIIFTLFIIILLPLNMAPAYEIDFNILNLYLSNAPKTLGMGRIDLNDERENVDLYHPARLVYDDKTYISYIFAGENVLNDNESEGKGCRIKSKESQLTGIINFRPAGIIKKSSIGFRYSVDNASGHADHTSDNFYFDYNKTIRKKLLTYGIQIGKVLSLGAGLEEYNKKKDSYWEFEFRTHPFLSLGARAFTRKFNLDLSIEKEDSQGLIPIIYSEDVLEIMAKINFHKRLMAHFVFDGKHLNRKKIRLSSRISKKFSLSYFRQLGNFNYRQDLFFDGLDSGHNNGEAEYGSWSAGLEFKRTKGTIYLFNVRKLSFSTQGAGLIKADAVLNFWETLLAGKRYFNYKMSLDSTQYHIGVESNWTKRLTMRTGLQYIKIRPEGIFDHWTPFPFIGIGKFDEDVSELSYSKITLGIFSMGFSYRVKNIEFTYGLGQYIPLSFKQKGEDVIDGDGSDGGEKKKEWYKTIWDDIKEAWDKIKDNPGGTLHSIEVKWYF